MTWSLSQLLSTLHEDIQQRLEKARICFDHPGTKGDASEKIWLELLREYLPQRYQATNGHIVDSNGVFSDQIDVIVFDRQYSPFIFKYEDQKIIPAESVYAVFEAKQTINSTYVAYAQEKVKSVRKLHRTSLPIPYAGGTYPPKPLNQIYGGILTFDSNWKPALGQPLLDCLQKCDSDSCLNLGCIASYGCFSYNMKNRTHELHDTKKSATMFLFNLIKDLQKNATVPMIDIQAYAKWMVEDQVNKPA